MTNNNALNNIWQKGTAFLGSEYAILGGAMSWVSERNLVSALSNAGGFGVLACGAMPPTLLAEEIQATKKLTNRPFGVNLIVMHPSMDELLDVCIANKVSHVVLAGGIPKTNHIEKLKSANVKTLCFAPSAKVGQKLIKMGADALIIEGMEAGGHIGPVASSVLAQEILPYIKEVPIFVAGGIGRGEAIVNYLNMGAAGCQLGTMFVCAEESIAHENFKQAFIKSSSRDAVASVQLDPEFPVIPVRALANKATESFRNFQLDIISQYQRGEIEKKAAQLQIEHFWAGALRKAVIDGDVENGSIMAGQSVGMVNKIQPMQKIIDELIAQANNFLRT